MKRMICRLLCLTLICLIGLAPAESVPETEDRLTRFLADCAAEEENPWMQAILQAGAREATWQGNRADFLLRGFDPEIKTLGSYTEARDKQAWRDQAAERMKAYSLKASVTFSEDGSVSEKQKKAFLKTVRTAAKKAKSAFGKKSVQRFLTDLLFRTPEVGRYPKTSDLMIADPDFAAFIASDPERFPCESATEWIPFMYAQRNWKINAGKGGPHRMVMTWEGADPEKMISGALEQCRAAMKDQKGSRPQNLSYYWRSSLAETALQMKKKKLPAMETEIDLDELLEGRTPESYRAYLAGYRPAEAYRLLEEETGAAPAAPEDGED